MYSKSEVKLLKKEFWTAFGVIMKPHFSAEGLKINWINYKTGVKDISFKMDADKKNVSIAIELSHKDDIRELYWEQFLEFRNLFHSIMEEEWEWGENYAISISTNGNIYDKDQWQHMFAFLKTRMIKLDEFWSDAQEMFKSL